MSIVRAQDLIADFGRPPFDGETITAGFLAKVVRDEILEKLSLCITRPQIGQYLYSRFFALISDATGGIPYVNWGHAGMWRERTYRTLPAAPIIWVRVDNLDAFVRNVLPNVDGPFVLITTDADNAPWAHTPEAARTLLECEKVFHWFADQCDLPSHPKVTPVPIGIPYPYRYDCPPTYKDCLDRDVFGHYRIVPPRVAVFDDRLAKLIAARKSPVQRKLVAFADFALNDSPSLVGRSETRRDIARKLSKCKAVTFLDRPVARFSLYHCYSSVAFVISPLGRAFDCYRTWEALLMGAIPITKRSPVTGLYDQYPIVTVDDWSEVTEDNLERWMERYGEQCQSADVEQRLRFCHWSDLVVTKREALRRQIA
jgi:hypothetical protein